MHKRIQTFSVLTIIVCAIVANAPIAYGKPAHAKTVRDYFLLLPNIYFEIPLTQRKAWLNSKGNIVDIKNDYIAFQGDGAQAPIEVAVFRYKGEETIAIYYEAVDGSLDFLRYRNGHWTNVTKQVLPIAFSGDNVYELPRHGTTIRVTANKFNEATQERVSKVGKHIYDLAWTHGKFVVRR